MNIHTTPPPLVEVSVADVVSAARTLAQELHKNPLAGKFESALEVVRISRALLAAQTPSTAAELEPWERVLQRIDKSPLDEEALAKEIMRVVGGEIRNLELLDHEYPHTDPELSAAHAFCQALVDTFGEDAELEQAAIHGSENVDHKAWNLSLRPPVRM